MTVPLQSSPLPPKGCPLACLVLRTTLQQQPLPAHHCMLSSLIINFACIAVLNLHSSSKWILSTSESLIVSSMFFYNTIQGEHKSMCALQLCGPESAWTAGTKTFWVINGAGNPKAISISTATTWKWWPVFHWIFQIPMSCNTLWWFRFNLHVFVIFY